MKYRILAVLALAFIAIQFIRSNRSVPVVDAAQDLCTTLRAPSEVRTLLRAACYDCHSYQTHYPWYGQVAPISWWLDHHVKEAREHINFSVFGSMPPHEQTEALEACSEVVLDGEMPLRSYTWIHAEARLTAEQRRSLAAWFSDQARTGGAVGRAQESNK
ncbi:MAG: heme-binding domain-containing protein [Saprospiraceae bacterium]|nr:heme-binding domain-containing protein [Saprospiraceae bacterium]MDW8484109.1 heme-binding domain-containing protein [Saprospiraceae bacterium]